MPLNSHLVWRIALRYGFSPWRERGVSFVNLVAVGGVALGVGALVVAMAVMSGYRENLVRAMAGAAPHVSLEAPRADQLPDPVRLREVLSEFGPLRISPYFTREILLQPLRQAERMRGVLLRGVGGLQEAQYLLELLRGSTQAPRAAEREAGAKEGATERAKALLDALSKRPDGAVPVLMGRALADSLEIALGDRILALSFPTAQSGFAPRALPERLVLQGYISSGVPALDEVIVITHRAHASVFAMEGFGGLRRGLGLRFREALRASEAARTLRAHLPGVGLRFGVFSWLERNAALFAVIQLQKQMLFLVLGVIVLIACFGMASALVLLVVEKTREVSILKALGMEPRTIHHIFHVQGLFVGAAGILLGMLLGIAASGLLDTLSLFELPPGVYPGSDRVPVRISGWDLLAIGGMALGICLVAAWIPAHKAAQLPTLEGLRRRM